MHELHLQLGGKAPERLPIHDLDVEVVDDVDAAIGLAQHAALAAPEAAGEQDRREIGPHLRAHRLHDAGEHALDLRVDGGVVPGGERRGHDSRLSKPGAGVVCSPSRAATVWNSRRMSARSRGGRCGTPSPAITNADSLSRHPGR